MNSTCVGGNQTSLNSTCVEVNVKSLPSYWGPRNIFVNVLAAVIIIFNILLIYIILGSKTLRNQVLMARENYKEDIRFVLEIQSDYDIIGIDRLFVWGGYTV